MTDASSPEVGVFGALDRRGVATLTLNRPERLNAWTGEMERAYFALLEDCAAREEVRAIGGDGWRVLTPGIPPHGARVEVLARA